MKCLDLFSGIGGMGRLLPFEPVMFCEWDDFPRRVLERRMKSGDLPNVPIHGDVRTLKPPDHDILILSIIHISAPTRLRRIGCALVCV